MNNKNFITLGIVALGVVVGALIMFIGPNDSDHSHDEEGHEHAAEEAEFERGPHNGRLLRDGDVAIEMTIFEDSVPPEFRVYACRRRGALGGRHR
jgi:hypothetical protein